jgi:hypothetical protein
MRQPSQTMAAEALPWYALIPRTIMRNSSRRAEKRR